MSYNIKKTNSDVLKSVKEASVKILMDKTN